MYPRVQRTPDRPIERDGEHSADPIAGSAIDDRIRQSQFFTYFISPSGVYIHEPAAPCSERFLSPCDLAAIEIDLARIDSGTTARDARTSREIVSMFSFIHPISFYFSNFLSSVCTFQRAIKRSSARRTRR